MQQNSSNFDSPCFTIVPISASRQKFIPLSALEQNILSDPIYFHFPPPIQLSIPPTSVAINRAIIVEGLWPKLPVIKFYSRFDLCKFANTLTHTRLTHGQTLTLLLSLFAPSLFHNGRSSFSDPPSTRFASHMWEPEWGGSVISFR